MSSFNDRSYANWQWDSAVMDARVNISNQEVFRLARSVDKDGIRTVGVITKCDALQPGDEKEVSK
jgi:hypothetical protein